MHTTDKEKVAIITKKFHLKKKKKKTGTRHHGNESNQNVWKYAKSRKRKLQAKVGSS